MTRRSLIALVFFSAAALAAAQKRGEPSSTIAGTVFRDPGYALPDAKVLLLSAGDKTKKLQETTSNYRGEFTFHVPAREAKYVVKAMMKGYRPQEREASIQGEERIDVNLVLVPESK